VSEATHVSEDRRVWWERRRLTFSVAVAAGYVVTIMLYESVTPWWTGDHIGLSPASLVFVYVPVGLIWVGAANIAYGLARLLETIAKPVDVPTFRRRAFTTITALGTTSTAIWYGGWMIEAWLRHR
jgi:hypothetical protein